MQWGCRWGNPWGKINLDDNQIAIMDFEETPPAALVTWPDQSSNGEVLYHIYADGKFYETTYGTEIVVQFQNVGRHFIQIFMTGLGNMDEDLTGCLTTIPGARVKLEWTASISSDVAYHKVYWDEGLGGDLVLLGRTKALDTCFVTDVVVDGNYVFRVNPVDFAGNETTSASTMNIEIARFPDPPSTIELGSYNGDTGIASFSFNESPTASVTEYRVYHNSGSGLINYDTVQKIVVASNSSFALAIGSGQWLVALRAYNGTHEEDNVDVFVEFEIGGSPKDLLEQKPNIPEACSAMPAAGGRFTLRCHYDALEELGKATKVNFYANDGMGGAVNFSSPVATGVVDDHLLGEPAIIEVEATSIVFIDGKTYNFVAKSATASGRESDATEIFSGTADATPPADITGLTVIDVNYEECDE